MISFLYALAFTATVVGSASAAELRHAEAVDPQHIKAKYLSDFEKRVETATTGALKVKTFYSDSLYSIASGLNALATGELELMSPPIARLTKLAPQAGAVEIPLLFDTQEKADLFMHGDAVTRLLAPLSRYGITPMSGWPQGSYVVVSKGGHLASPKDFAGKRIRNSGHEPSEDLLKAMGATPVRVPIAETYSALDQGLVDGVLTSIASYHAQKLFELAPYAVYWPILGNYVLLANSEKFNALPPEQQRAVRTGWSDVGAQMSRDLAAEENALVDEMTAGGAKVRQLTVEEKQAMLDIGGKKIQQDFRGKHPEAFTIIEGLAR